jgi:hypothetical protein
MLPTSGGEKVCFDMYLLHLRIRQLSLYHAICTQLMGERIVALIDSNVRFLLKAICACILACSVIAALAAETRHEVNPETGVQTWELHDQGVGFTLMQITPDQARAFFLARGFDREAVDYYASHCVFMTIVRNESVPESISYNLSDWLYFRKNSNKPGKLKLKDDWLNEWRQRKVAEPALIAFEWSQHPTFQTFEIGDWNQGMTTYAMPLGSVFNLKFLWKVNGAIHEATLKEVQCAGDTAGR